MCGSSLHGRSGGGGAFVLFYLLFLVILGLPIMTMEFAVGRASHKSPVRAYQARDARIVYTKVENKGISANTNAAAALAAGEYLALTDTTTCWRLMRYTR